MYRIRQALLRFMMGRRGMDQLGVATYCTGLFMWVLELITGLSLFGLLSTALWIYGLFRMLSRNLFKREKENRWFLGWYNPLKIKFNQAQVRFKNRKVYKYFRCPKCKSWLKLPRNVGEKVVTCGKCGEKIHKKA